MKAIKLLKEYQVFFGASSQIPNKEINEAISELEELMKPKSCDGCRYDSYPLPYECRECGRNYADRYEPKEQP